MKPHPDIVYHASPKSDLHIKGLDNLADPTVTKGKSGFNYLGSHDYIHNQYLKYAKPDKYTIYKINTHGLEADDTKLAGEQQRYGHKIEPHRITKVNTVDTRKNSPKHPDEDEYLKWFNSVSRPN